jgi:hypothetical protein
MSGRPTITVELAADQLGAAPWLYQNAEVLDRVDDAATGGSRLRVRVADQRWAPFQEWALRERVSIAASDRASGAA